LVSLFVRAIGFLLHLNEDTRDLGQPPIRWVLGVSPHAYPPKYRSMVRYFGDTFKPIFRKLRDRKNCDRYNRDIGLSILEEPMAR
jgi:hypothetical protein